MQFDKSLKLLNYAQVDGINNNLRLYTELDHSFKVGDKLFIVGGFYENINNLSYITSYNISNPNQYNPFSDGIYYTVLDVNYNNNSFVIDYEVGTLTYPYVSKDKPEGTLADPFSFSPSTDPNILINTKDAYNSYNTQNAEDSEIYKGVYVSRAVFNSGIFNSGEINNGIFGSDYYTIALSSNITDVTNVPSDNVYISHFISKNTTITKGQIRSKTFGANINTRKFKLIEDNTVTNGPNNPFYIQQVSTGANNNGYGYTLFEKFETLQTLSITDILTIYNTEINNNLKDSIILNNVTYDNCKIGNNDIAYTSKMSFNNLQKINNSFVGNGDMIFELDQSELNNYIELDVLSYSFNANYLSLIVNYDTFANKELPTVGRQVFLSNIQHNTDEYHVFQDTYLLYDDVLPYTYGDYASGIELQLELSNNNISTVLGQEGDFDFSNVKLYKKNSSTLGTITNSQLSYYLQEEDIYVENSTFKHGYFNNLIYKNSDVNNNGNDKIILINVKQLLNNNTSNNNTDDIINNALIQSNFYVISGEISNTNISNGFIYQANLTNNVIVDSNSKLDTVELGNNIYIDDTITHFNNIGINNAVKQGSSVNFVPIYDPVVENSYPQSRLTPFVTGKLAQTLPIPDGEKAYNFNSLKLTGSIYNSQKIINTDNIGYTDNYEILYEVPNFTVPTDPDLTYSVSYGGYMIFKDTILLNNNSLTGRDFITDFGVASNIIGLVTRIQDRTTVNPSGTISPFFPGVSQPIGSPSDIAEVPINYLQQSNSFYKSLDRFRTEAEYTLFDQSHIIDDKPSYDQNIANLDNIIKLKLDGVTDYTITNGQSLAGTVASDIYNLRFFIDGTFDDGNGNLARDFPACFIEIESVHIDDSSNPGLIVYNTNQIPEYTFTSQATAIPHNGFNQYAVDNIVDFSDINTDFIITGERFSNNNSDAITINYTGQLVTVTVHYWITWNYAEFIEPTAENPFLSNRWEFSRRTKHEFTFNMFSL